MRMLIDTNIVLDVLLDRSPHVKASAAVWSMVESGRAEGVLAAHSITTIHYLIQKEVGNIEAKRIIAAILRVFKVAPVNSEVLQDALHLPFADFEDAVTAAAAVSASCDVIVTSDPKGFRSSPVRTLTPEAALPLVT